MRWAAMALAAIGLGGAAPAVAGGWSHAKGEGEQASSEGAGRKIWSSQEGRAYEGRIVASEGDTLTIAESGGATVDLRFVREVPVFASGEEAAQNAFTEGQSVRAYASGNELRALEVLGDASQEE